MLDVGLLVSGVAIFVVLSVAPRWAAPSILEPAAVLDRLLAPALAGLVAARVTAAALDDPTSLQSVRALLVIRGGVEFWAGVAVTVSVFAWTVRRDRMRPSLALADVAPFALWGYATYEAMCVFRDGCYGPASSIGLVPDGLQTRMFPVGLATAASVTLLGFAVRNLWAWSPTAKMLLAVGGLAATRAVASFWLPHLGDGPTRQHVESIAVTAAVTAIALGRTLRAVRRENAALRTPVSSDSPGIENA